LIFAQIDTLFLAEFVSKPVDYALNEVIPTQMRIPIGRLFLKPTLG